MGISSIVSDVQQLIPGRSVKGMIGDVEVDVIVKESPMHSWTVTSHTVEAGYEANDLRKRNPDDLVLDCVWVDKQYGVRDIIGNVLSSEGLMPETWRDKYEEFKEMWNNDETITVITGLDSYDSMVISSVSPVREQSTAGSFVCTVTLKQVRIVSTDTRNVDTSLLPATAAADDDVKKKKAKKKKKRTKTNETKDGAAGDKERTSMLYDLMH